MCLESLLHHCSVERYSTDIADLNGLPLLMEIYKRYSEDINVTVKLCQILSYMSYNRHLLEPFCKSGEYRVAYGVHHIAFHLLKAGLGCLPPGPTTKTFEYPSQQPELWPTWMMTMMRDIPANCMCCTQSTAPNLIKRSTSFLFTDCWVVSFSLGVKDNKNLLLLVRITIKLNSN